MKTKTFAYTGSYTTSSLSYNRYPSGVGLHVFELVNDGWESIQDIEIQNPAFLCFSKDKRTLYAACSKSPEPICGIATFHVEKDGTLKSIKNDFEFEQPICCLTVDCAGTHMIAADFKGNLFLISLNADGTMHKILDKLTFTGTIGPLRKIQECARPHQVPFDLDGRFLIIPDKGLDEIHTLEIKKNKFHRIDDISVRAASCMRHIAFHPNRQFAYAVAEFTSRVYAMRYDSTTGHLDILQSLATERDLYTGNYCKASEIEVHPEGKMLYVSNRGDDTIGEFSIDEHTGLLKPVGWVNTGGAIPRYFCLNDEGTRLYACNQKTGNIVEFDVIPKTYELKNTGRAFNVPCPTYLLFKSIAM